MGNSFGCSASGERLVSAARDGDLVEAKMLLDCNPCLAKYSTFGGLNSPLHFAATKGHNEVSLLYPHASLFHFLFKSEVYFLFILLCLLDCSFVAWERSWCQFEKLLWTGIKFLLLFPLPDIDLYVWDFFYFSKWDIQVTLIYYLDLSLIWILGMKNISSLVRVCIYF